MIYGARTARVAPGKNAEAVDFAKRVVEYAKSRHGLKIKAMVQVGGPVGRMAWLSEYDNLGVFEQVWGKLFADPGFQEILKEGPNIFRPDATEDSLWSVIA